MAAENMTSSLAGKNIIITGGTTGIGREVALQLADIGANVLINGQNEDHLKDTVNDIKQGGPAGSVNGVVADLGTGEGITRLFEEADRFFNGQLDVLINNAALAYGTAEEGTYDDWKKVVDTNLLSYIACSNEALTRMAKASKGHIVNIGSMSADVRDKGSSIYVATKAGIQGFSESLRKEVNERGINVILIEPGATDTDMQKQSASDKKSATERHEMLTSADVAGAVIYALSQDQRCDVVEIRLRPRLQLI